AGDVLARQDTARLTLQVEQARANLAAAEANLAQLEAGPREQEVAAAEASVRAAEAQISAAAANRDEAASGPSAAALASAQADLTAAIASRDAAEEIHEKTLTCKTVHLPWGKTKEMTICPGLGPTEERLRHNMEISEMALAAAQATYDELASGADAAA